MNKKNKKRHLGKSLNDRFVEKRQNKVIKQGLNILRCVGGCHSPEGCGNEFLSYTGCAACPKCGNQYCLWVNAPQ